MQCAHYDAGRCRSCSELPIPYERQLQTKQQHAQALLAAWPALHWLPSVRSAERGFRNKAKMVVSGTARQPVLGIVDEHGRGVDLRDCGLYPESMQAALTPLRDFVREAALPPYDIAQRRGELKYLLLTEADDGALMLRFVLRTEAVLPRIRERLPTLLATLPQLQVVSANLLPEHKAVLEGEREIALTPQQRLRMRVGGLPLYLGPRSFFQTNTEVAGALYRQARDWVQALQPSSLWDLYCGVGGFAMHCAAPGREVLGIELSAEAISHARASLVLLPADIAAGMQFIAADATDYLLRSTRSPPLAIVNPPRRGIGEALARRLDAGDTRWLIYSSCNAESLVRDLAWMPAFRPVEARLLDMFPHTRHYELIVLLQRN